MQLDVRKLYFPNPDGNFGFSEKQISDVIWLSIWQFDSIAHLLFTILLLPRNGHTPARTIESSIGPIGQPVKSKTVVFIICGSEVCGAHWADWSELSKSAAF